MRSGSDAPDAPGPDSPGADPTEAGGKPAALRAPAGSRRLAILLPVFPKLSETFIAQEIHLLERRGFDVEIYSLTEPDEEQIQSVADEVAAPVFVFPRSRTEKPRIRRANRRALRRHGVRYILAAVRALAQAVAERDPKEWSRFVKAGWLVGERPLGSDGIPHIHSHFLGQPSQIAAHASRIAGITFTISAHAVDIYTGSVPVTRRLVRAAEALMTCTEMNAEWLRQRTGAGSDIHVVKHGIDTRRFKPIAPSAGGGSSVARLVSVGRLVPKKGYGDTLDALGRLHDRGVDFHYDVYGAGPLLNELEERAAKLGIARSVEFHGAVTQGEVIPALQRGGIFLCACREDEQGNRDGIPNSLAEAMAVGLPVIATNFTAIPELVEDGTNGLLVEPADPEGLADAIERLVRDGELAARIGRAGRECVTSSFEASRCIDDCIEILARFT